MRFFLISNMYPDENSPGYGTFVKNICDHLSLHGIKEAYHAVIKGKTTNKYNKIYKYIKVYYKILKYYFKTYDFIYVHYPNQFVPLLFLLRILKTKTIIVNFHGEDLLYRSFGYRKILGKLTESFCRKFANVIVVPSEYFHNIVIKKNIIDESKIIISPSGGINPQIFYPSDSPVVAKNYINIGFVGRLQIDKGIKDFAEICKLLIKSYKIPVKAIVIGYGDFYDELIDYVTCNKLSDHFNVIQGVPQPELGNYYREMDLFIFNSKRSGESLGLTGLEAMGCGVPVIGSNIGGIASYVKDGYNGWLTPVGDLEAIIESIIYWSKLHVEDKTRLKANAIQTAKGYYSQNISSSLAKSLKGIIGPSSNQAHTLT